MRIRSLLLSSLEVTGLSAAAKLPHRGIQSLVICGPSGVGKGTIISELLRKYPKDLALSVSHTTRAPRKGEVDGFHYHFISKDEMEKSIEAAESTVSSTSISSGSIRFIEYARVHGSIYGTSFGAVESIHKQNKLCVLDVDTRGVRQLKACNFEAKYVFVRPPSESDLRTRLEKRGTETEEAMATRLKNAAAEIEYGLSGCFDKVLVNDSLQRCVTELEMDMEEWFPNRLHKQQPQP